MGNGRRRAGGVMCDCDESCVKRCCKAGWTSERDSSLRKRDLKGRRSNDNRASEALASIAVAATIKGLPRSLARDQG